MTSLSCDTVLVWCLANSEISLHKLLLESMQRKAQSARYCSSVVAVVRQEKLRVHRRVFVDDVLVVQLVVVRVLAVRFLCVAASLGEAPSGTMTPIRFRD